MRNARTALVKSDAAGGVAKKQMFLRQLNVSVINPLFHYSSRLSRLGFSRHSRVLSEKS